MNARWKWIALLALVVLLFYWKVVFTAQFSIWLEYEGANQGYSWYHFWVTSLKQGTLPLWDPYTHAGRSFPGEMQTGTFYPLKLLLVPLPLDRYGLFSPRWAHLFFVLVHFLGACFMFALVRELRLSAFSGFVAGVCFSLGGFVSRIGWPDMLDSAIWLPLIFLLLLRAMRAESLRLGLFYAAAAGLGLGISVLGGRLHIVMMQTLAVIAAAAFAASHSARKPAGFPLRGHPWVWAAVVVAVAGVLSFAAGAVQLFPSFEYRPRALRYLSDTIVLPVTQRIPYHHLSDGLSPRALLAFLLAFPFGGNIGSSEIFTPYFGVLPFVLALAGIAKNWAEPWLRFLALLAVLSFFYSLGSFSFLHGVLYPLVPFLWMAREAGRFIYLTNFALAVAAAYGTESLFQHADADRFAARVSGILKWPVLAGACLLSIPAVYGRPEVNDWIFLSFLFLLGAYGVMRYAARNRGATARFAVAALIVCDLNAFAWIIESRSEVTKAGRNHLERLLSCRGTAAFLRSQPGLFRVHIATNWAPNLGDLYGIQTIDGMGATLLRDFERMLTRVPRSSELLNVRYVVKPRDAAEPGAVYEDPFWKVYENRGYFPRGWIVHETALEPSPEKVPARMAEPGFDARRTALLQAPLDSELEPKQGEQAEDVAFQSHRANRIELTTRAHSRGLLVLSEVYYPGWQATVNGRPAGMVRVDGLFRGIVVPPGESRVVLRYRPRSILAGALLTLLAFLGTLSLGIVAWLSPGHCSPAEKPGKQGL